MKRIVLTIAVLLSINISNICAERLIGEPTGPEMSTSTNSSVRTIKAPRFARPLVEKWISEYAKVEPGIQFIVAKGSQQDIDLNVVFDNQETNTKDFSHIVYFGETAVLPITARSSEAARLLEGKHLNSKKLKQLFFLNDDLEEDTKRNKQFEQIIVYSGSNASSVASSFAHNFGEESSNFRGKRISGDDLFLNTALSKDPLGVSFNALPNIFDLKSRHVKDDLSIVGLDLKKGFAESINDEGNLDNVLQQLENGKPAEIAIEKVGISYHVADDAVSHFLEWVLENGTKYNHEFGLLNLDQKVTQAQIEQVKTHLTAQK
jgi:hypothetical protein